MLNYLKGFLLSILALLSPNTALPLLFLWIGGEHVIVKRLAIFQSFPQDILKILACLLGWAVISSFWSLSPYDSAIASIKLLGFVLLGVSWLAVCSQQSSSVTFLFMKGLAIGCSSVAIFMLTDYASGEPFVHFREVGSIKVYSAASHVLALCFYPLCFWIYRKIDPLLCFLFAGTTIAALYTVDIDIILVSLLLGGLVQGLAFLLPRKVFKIMWQAGFTLLVGIFPFICAFVLSPVVIQNINQNMPIFSYIHRLYIWHFLSEKVVHHPLIGYGFDTTRLYKFVHPPLYTWTFFEKTGGGRIVQNTPHYEPLFYHAHNFIIQWWFELGLVGVLLSGLFFLKVFARAHELAHPQRIMTFGYSTTAIAIALASVDFWNSWWFAALWISSGIVALVNAHPRSTLD
ncbi:MAG: O-antigen ligase family protein [Alphaproteobacteria bacterium]